MNTVVFGLIVIALTWARIGVMIAKKRSERIQFIPFGPDD